MLNFSCIFLHKFAAMQTVLLSKPDLFSFKECLWFLDRNYDECLHRIDAEAITKAISLNGNPLVFTLEEDEKNILLKTENKASSSENMDELRRYVIDWMDMERNIEPFYELLKRDKKLSYMAKDFSGLRLIGIADLYETLCWCIIGQQINLSFAYKIKRRLVENYGRKLITSKGEFLLFPEPETMAGITEEKLKELQFSRQKANYIIYISKAFCEGRISQGKLSALKTTEERLELLTSLKGIGEWTANYALMKTLRDPDSVPYGDIGLLNALSNHQLIRDRKDKKNMEKLFRKFEGWKSYLVFYLWRSLASPSFQAK